MVKNRSKVKKNVANKKGVVRKRTPLATTSSRQTVNKQIHQKGDVVVIHHRELLQATYVASQEFSVDSRIAINPGLSTYSSGSPMGSWLPSIAKNYDRYRFKTLKFHFRTYAATTTPGMVIMSYDPNPDNANPGSLAETQNMYFRDGSVHEDLCFDVSPKLTSEFKFTRSGPVTSLVNYDQGFVNFSSIGSTNTAVGIMEVEYVVEFKQPQSGNTQSPVLPNIPVLPTCVLEATAFADGIVDALYSTTTTQGNINAPTQVFRTGNTYGAPLITVVTITTPSSKTSDKWRYPNGVSKDPGTYANVRFQTNDTTSWPIGGTSRTFFRFKNSGRYRVLVEAPFDINVNSTAGYQLFGFLAELNGNGPPPSWSLPITEAVDLSGNVTTYKAQRVHVQQGVQNSATSPKTAGDSTQRFEFEIAASISDAYALLGGSPYLVNDGDVNFTARTTVTAPARLIIQYLGPRLTDVGLYDI